MKKFRKIYLEITNICNMHCSFCPETTRAKAFMSVEDFEYIAKEIKPYTDYVYLHVKGEPLLHPNLKEILDVCNECNLKVNISTNATLLKEKFKIIKEANIRQLNISLHSFENKEDSNKIEDYLQTITALCDKLAEQGVIIRYKLWNAEKEANNNEIQMVKFLSTKYNIELQTTPYEKDKKLAANIFVSIKSPFKWPDMTAKEKNEGKCYGLRNQIAILVDGTVVPCCVDNNGDINIGNIFTTSLEKILKCERAIKIRQGFEDNKCVEILCKKCEYRRTV